MNLSHEFKSSIRNSIVDVGKYLKISCGLENNIKKSTAPNVDSTDLHNALTYMDKFTQDYLALQVSKLSNSIRYLLEEDTNILLLSDKNSDTIILIDPIDGTKQFIDGGEDYSTLFCLLYKGKPVWAIGYYPQLDIFIEDDLKRDDSNTNKISCHYRINKKENLPYKNLLTKFGYELEWNGHGFFTNLTAATRVISGKSKALVFPYTAAHDAIAPAQIVKQHGGYVQQYSIEERWTKSQRLPWQISLNTWDQEIGSPRIRLIAAMEERHIQDIEHVLSS